MRSKKNPFINPVLITESYTSNRNMAQGEAPSLFPNPRHLLYVDLGTGRGQFLSKASRLYPHINWLGIEKKAIHLFQAIKKRKVNRDSNLHYIWMDIEQLPQVFSQGQVNRFYLNFSTPWETSPPKRLTHRRFLKMYQELLAPDGDLLFKTDHPDLFEFSLKEFKEMNWEILEETRDLHNSIWNKQNITTEWEDKRSELGCPIYYIRLKPNFCP